VSRNNFVKTITVILGAVIGAVIGIPAIAYIITPAVTAQATNDWIPVGPLENYPVGVPTLFNFTRTIVNGWERTVNSYGVYILRGAMEEVKALSNMCTHLSCRVTWKEDEQIYFCPCHDGLFDLVGDVVSGPPPRPLDEYPTKVEDGTLYIFFVRG
jgi:Rieske Fe-S protein